MDIHPEKIILFGSYASGKEDDDSDIDLLVVTDDNFYPSSYREKMDYYLNVSKNLRELRKEYPVDLIVHTRPMHEKFIQMDSSFARDILNNGIVLYEKDNRRLAGSSQG